MSKSGIDSGPARLWGWLARLVQPKTRSESTFSSAPTPPRLSWVGLVLAYCAFLVATAVALAGFYYIDVNGDLHIHAEKRIEKIDRIFTSAINEMKVLAAVGTQCDGATTEALIQSSLSSAVVKRFYSVASSGATASVCSPVASIGDPVGLLLAEQAREITRDKIDVNIKVVPKSYGDFVVTSQYKKEGFFAAQIPATIVRDLLTTSSAIGEPRVRMIKFDGIALLDTGWDDPSQEHGWSLSFEQEAHSSVLPLTIQAQSNRSEISSSVMRYGAVSIGLALLLTTMLANLFNQRLARRASVENRLQIALRKRQFEPVVQPIVDCETGRCLGGEVLMRWQHPVRGLLSPVEFLDVAEQTGLIHPMSMLIIMKARDRLAPIVRRDPSLYFTFNVTAAQLQRPDFADLMETVFDDESLPPENVVIELIERDVVDDASRSTLDDLRSRGFRVAIDDFGTGQSSLALVTSMKFDVLKIDREFVQAVDSESIHRSVLTSIADLAARIGVRSVAEGVETVAQHQFLISQGVDAIQGYLIASPMPIDEFEVWYGQNRSGAKYADSSNSVIGAPVLSAATNEIQSSSLSIPQGEPEYLL